MRASMGTRRRTHFSTRPRHVEDFLPKKDFFWKKIEIDENGRKIEVKNRQIIFFFWRTILGSIFVKNRRFSSTIVDYLNLPKSFFRRKWSTLMLVTTMLTTVTMLMTTMLTTTMSTTTMSRFGLLAPGRDPKPPNEVSYYVSKYTSAESAVTNSSCNVPRCLRKRCGDVCPSRANVSASFAHKHSRSWATMRGKAPSRCGQRCL